MGALLFIVYLNDLPHNIADTGTYALLFFFASETYKPTHMHGELCEALQVSAIPKQENLFGTCLSVLPFICGDA